MAVLARWICRNKSNTSAPYVAHPQAHRVQGPNPGSWEPQRQGRPSLPPLSATRPPAAPAAAAGPSPRPGQALLSQTSTRSPRRPAQGSPSPGASPRPQHRPGPAGLARRRRRCRGNRSPAPPLPVPPIPCRPASSGQSRGGCGAGPAWGHAPKSSGAEGPGRAEEGFPSFRVCSASGIASLSPSLLRVSG